MNFATVRWIAIAALVIAAHSALAAGYPGVVITPPEKGEYVYWVIKAPTPSEGKEFAPPPFLMRGAAKSDGYPECLIWPTALDGDSAKVEIEGIEPPTAEKGKKPVQPSVVVGLYAIKANLCGQKIVALDPEAAVEVSFADSDFDHVGRLVVDVGEVKTGALVLETDSWRTAVTLLPSDKGMVEVSFVPIGSIKATLRYDKTESETLKTEVRSPEKGAEQTVKLIPEGYERKAVEEEPEGAETEKTQEREKQKPSAASSLRSMLFAIVVIAAIAIAAYYFLRSRNITLEKALNKLGVNDVPQPQSGAPGTDAAAKPLVPEGYCEFCGQQRDAAGNCACSATPGGAVVPGAALGAAAAAKLVGTIGQVANQVFVLSDVTTIGREPDNTIPLTQDTTASRRHAEIKKQPDGYVISDLGSSNGTLVNGSRISQRTLQHGDEVRIGAAGFRFEIS